jgi:hypothetical protein
VPLTAKQKADRLKPRKCLYCKARFFPKRVSGKPEKFCSPNHRKAFHRYGGLPFDKLMARIQKEVRAIVKEEIRKEVEIINLNLRALAARPLTPAIE